MNDRLIEFRAWDKFEKKMISWDECLNNEALIPEILLNAVRYEPMQCTGLKDKNGRLIYEGDIVKAEVEEPELKVIGIITFGRYVHDLGFYVEWKGAPAESRKYYPGWRQDLFYWLEEESLEVIGKIHENPELLEEEK